MDELEKILRRDRMPSDARPARGCGIRRIGGGHPASINRNSRLSEHPRPRLTYLSPESLPRSLLTGAGIKLRAGRWVLICPRRQINFAGAPRIRFVRIVHSVIGAVAAPCHARLRFRVAWPPDTRLGRHFVWVVRDRRDHPSCLSSEFHCFGSSHKFQSNFNRLEKKKANFFRGIK